MLRIEGLVKRYRTGDLALKGVDLEVPQGQVMALIGPSGAGKSTLIRCINRLVEPTSGKIFLKDLELTRLGKMELRRARRRMGMIFQEYALVERLTAASNWVHSFILREIERVNERPMVYFTKGDDLVTLNRAALYVLDNEQTSRLQVVHVYDEEREIPPDLADHLRVVDHLYPQLRVDFVAVRGSFGPELVEALSRRLGVPKNYMFIGTPGDRFPHRIEDLGGVRVVL